MTIEFYNSVEIPSKVVIAGKEVEKVSSYKYLGTLIDDKLRWVENTNLIISKAQKRLYLLRKLKSFEVDKSILIMFYRSFIETVLTFAMICWFYGLNVKSRSQLQSIVHLGSKITGSVQLGLSALCERNVLRKSLTILDDTSHILFLEFELLPSGRRYRVPKWRTVKASRSFVSNAVECKYFFEIKIKVYHEF